MCTPACFITPNRFIIADMDCKIVMRWTYRDHLNQVHDYREEFVSIHHFKNYLRWETDKANQIGYGNRGLTHESRCSNVRVGISLDRKETIFENASQFGEFLKHHRQIAKALQA